MGIAQNDRRGVTVEVSLDAGGIDDERLDRQTRMLRAELAEMEGVETATLGRDSSGTAAGTKVADPITLGAIVLALSASGGVFTTLIETVRDWLGRQPGSHRVTVTIDGESIDVEAASDEQQRALVDAYIRRHAGVVAG
ncbi:effector-associated constant component EACC1 [Nocardia tengchongensis]|uniref:effector-associated constant component EACC1 n=1 Tax=Nocardia tengchongensis TaxID=2055889 RepID=UPI00365F4B97